MQQIQPPSALWTSSATVTDPTTTHASHMLYHCDVCHGYRSYALKEEQLDAMQLPHDVHLHQRQQQQHNPRHKDPAIQSTPVVQRATYTCHMDPTPDGRPKQAFPLTPDGRPAPQRLCCAAQRAHCVRPPAEVRRTLDSLAPKGPIRCAGLVGES